MKRASKLASWYQMYGPTNPPLRFGPVHRGAQQAGEEVRLGVAAIVDERESVKLVSSLPPGRRAAPVVEQREEPVGRLAAPAPVPVGADHGRGPVGRAVGEVPEERHQREVRPVAGRSASRGAG